jgi:ABC-2 type transport system permease protein
VTDLHADTGTQSPDGDAMPGSAPSAVVHQHEQELAARAVRVAARGTKPTRTVSARVSVWVRLVELWRARELFVFLVRKEIKVKYKNSVLGFVWSMLNPALTLAVFYVLFTYFLPNGIPHFVIYMFSAMLVWNFFQTALLGGTVSVVVNAGIVKKVAFPREILVLSSVGAALVFLFYQSLVMVGFMIAFRHSPAWGEIWLLIPALAAVIVFVSALAIFLSAVNVYLRDTQHLIEVLLVAWFWANPVVYAFKTTIHDSLERHTILFIPHSKLIWLYFSNPVAPIIMTFQRFFYNDYHPRSTIATHPLMANGLPSKHAVYPYIQGGVLSHYTTHWYVGADLAVLGVSILLFLGALLVFGHLEGNFAEEL